MLKEVHSAPYHPQTNGQIECTNQEIKQQVKTLIREGKCWSEHLSALIEVKNSSCHQTTKQIPYELLRGRALDPTTTRDVVEQHSQALANSVTAAQRETERWAAKPCVYEAQVGDVVLVRNPASTKRKDQPL